MNEEDDIQEQVVAVADPPQTASEVAAALQAIQERLDRRDQDLINQRDEEWRQYVASQEEPDPEPSYIDPKAIQMQARNAAVDDMKAILSTQEAIMDRVKDYGPEAIKMAKEAIAQANPETLKDPRNARVIAALIKDELMEQGKMPTTAPNAGNNGVSGKEFSAELSTFATGAGIDLGSLTAAEKAELQSVGIKV